MQQRKIFDFGLAMDLCGPRWTPLPADERAKQHLMHFAEPRVGQEDSFALREHFAHSRRLFDLAERVWHVSL